ncbi:MAG: hypothetical protein O2955_18610 [Planctomycetota bacterium]|nr:hypothetical protein [Planctomycetota bacterium]MDA1214526.1 hypothetical protein [Planctomycetota bacterium]
MRPRLKLYTPEECDSFTPEKISVRLGDISQALADAVVRNRTWVFDFADDEVQIPTDLYEIISAYWNLRPGA